LLYGIKPEMMSCVHHLLIKVMQLEIDFI